MQINTEIYTWLVNSNFISSDARKVNQDLFELSKEQVTLFESGLVFGKIIKKLSQIQSLATRKPDIAFPTLDTLKDTNSPASRIFNWNILIDCFKKLNIKVEQEIKSLIVGGDNGVIIEILKEVY